MDYVVNAGQTSAGRSNLATGNFTTDDSAVEVTLGFRPRVVKLVNATAATTYEKTDSMGAANTVRTVTAGTTTVTTTSDIVINDTGFTIRSGVAGDAQAYHFYAMD